MKLNYKRTVLIGMAFLSICAFWQMYDNIIPLILKNTFHLGETVTGAIMAADNILALFLLPLFGSFSDRIDTPIGKRMPFILTGTGCAFVFLLLLPVADKQGSLPLFIIALFLVLVSMGLYRSPAVALMPDLTPKPLRSKGNAVINLMGAVGGVYALIMISLLVGSGTTPDYFPLFLSIGLLMLFSIAVLYFTIPEKKLRAQINIEKETDRNKPSATSNLPSEVKRSLFFILLSVALWYIAYNAVTTAFSRYATHVWGLENGGYANCLMVATVASHYQLYPHWSSVQQNRQKTHNPDWRSAPDFLLPVCLLLHHLSRHNELILWYHRICLGSDKCQFVPHGSGNQRQRRCRQIYRLLLYLLHGSTGYHANSVRFPAGTCVLPDFVPLRGGIQHTGLLYHADGKARRFKTSAKGQHTGKF